MTGVTGAANIPREWNRNEFFLTGRPAEYWVEP